MKPVPSCLDRKQGRAPKATATVFCTGLVLCLSSEAVPAQNVSTTEIQLHYGDGFHLGRNDAGRTSRSVATLEHFTASENGDVFFFVDGYYDYDGLQTNKKSGHYGEIYGHLSGKALGLNFQDNSFVKDIAFGLGVNQSENLTIGLLGSRATFNVQGFSLLSLGLYAYETIKDPLDRDLDTTYQATLSWKAPFEFGGQNFTAKGFVDFIGDRGNGVDNQIVFSPQIRWDAGRAIGWQPNRFDLGIEYIHFKNKFGVSGVTDNSLSIFAAFKLH
ncbi:DUF5020 family protein [Parasedimentitalea marina]|uniref:DUF5020 family protein n=1 Tax=Parasedimentitalea marina TaxID=2483033 RepID=A0A3T0N7D3_9RHOB|nr:DUF5020 family protein [Parasedimentitalea marina]AZV79895.1 DUF5020 family protein [Parasedimentitalea marina]